MSISDYSEVEFVNGTFDIPDGSYVLIEQTICDGEKFITYHDVFGDYYIMGYDDTMCYNKLTDKFIRIIDIDD